MQKKFELHSRSKIAALLRITRVEVDHFLKKEKLAEGHHKCGHWFLLLAEVGDTKCFGKAQVSVLKLFHMHEDLTSHQEILHRSRNLWDFFHLLSVAISSHFCVFIFLARCWYNWSLGWFISRDRLSQKLHAVWITLRFKAESCVIWMYMCVFTQASLELQTSDKCIKDWDTLNSSIEENTKVRICIRKISCLGIPQMLCFNR